MAALWFLFFSANGVDGTQSRKKDLHRIIEHKENNSRPERPLWQCATYRLTIRYEEKRKMLRKLESFGAVPASLSRNVLRQNVHMLEGATTKLPANYRKFLLHFGASVLFNMTVVFRARQASPWADSKGFDSLESLYGLCKGRNQCTVFEALETYREDLHGQWLPIGASAGDNQICVCLKGALFGQVWYWDHEADPVFNDMEVVSGMTRVANTFEEFIGLLELRSEEVDTAGVVKVDLDF